MRVGAEGNPRHMGRFEDRAAQPVPAPEQGADPTHGMGLSSEHDEEKVQEVDSREEE
jgi:hypothetical protein